MTDPVVQQFLVLIEEGFRRRAWHGPNLLGSIRGLRPAEAAWRPGPGRHNIWELIVHCAYWKYAVTRRLTGAKRGSFAHEGSNWFRRDGGSASDLRADVALLQACHASLLAAAGTVSASQLGRRPAGSRQTRAAMLRGIACHDIYHAGQIQILKRLRGAG